jgi:hypothetical protein
VIVKLFDRTQIIISKAEAEQLGRALSKSMDGFVTIKGNMIRKTAIAGIMQGGMTEADNRPPDDSRARLRADNRSDAEQYKSARKAAEIARETLKRRGIIKPHS